MPDQIIQLLADKGTQAYQRGDFALSARFFADAVSAYAEAGNVLDAAEMKNNQSVALLQDDQPQAALEAVLGTAEIFSSANDVRRHGLALGNEAAALHALGRLDEAAPKYRQSADLLAQCGEDQLRANAMQALSRLQLKRGKTMDALASMQSGLGGIQQPSLFQKILKKILQLRP
jgi:tetratricopeptide (TPR) repeat protein